MNERYERQLKKGILEILVLQLLLKEKMYGYQMILCMKEKSQGMFEMNLKYYGKDMSKQLMKY